MNNQTLRGIANGVSRSDSGDVRVKLWVRADDGSGNIPVEVGWPDSVQNGDHIEVSGSTDSQGTLQAVSLKKITEAPQPPTGLRWGMIFLCPLLAVIVGTVLDYVVAGGKKTSAEWVSPLILALIFVNLRVSQRRGLHSAIVFVVTILLMWLRSKM
jgi:hypothetical protein